MTAGLYYPKTKTSIDHRNNLTILIATFVGAAIGAVATMGVAGGTLGTGTSTSLRSISATPTDFSSDGSGIYYNGQYYSSLAELCYVPSSVGMGRGAEVMPAPGAGAEAPMPAVVNLPEAGKGGGGGLQGGGQSGGNVTVIKKIIGGAENKTSVSLSNTGPYSNNEVTTVNKTTTVVKNTNGVNVSNSNTQQAGSGDAKVTTNTNAGSANSGDATNVNDTSTNVNISN